MKKKVKEKPVRWPKRRSVGELQRMKPAAVIRYARDLHAAWAERHRRDMEWDVFWVRIYNRLLKSIK